MSARLPPKGTLLAIVMVAAACSPAPSQSPPPTTFAPPTECRAADIPVDRSAGPFVFLVCGRPYLDPLYPTPMAWFGDERDLESALDYIVHRGSERVTGLGLWSGFDALPPDERSSLRVETELSDTGILDIRVLDRDGRAWQPPPALISSYADASMFIDVLAATALGFDRVTVVKLSVCPREGPAVQCGPLDRRALRARHPSEWNVDSLRCDLIDYWTVPECTPETVRLERGPTG